MTSCVCVCARLIAMHTVVPCDKGCRNAICLHDGGESSCCRSSHLTTRVQTVMCTHFCLYPLGHHIHSHGQFLFQRNKRLPVLGKDPDTARQDKDRGSPGPSSPSSWTFCTLYTNPKPAASETPALTTYRPIPLTPGLTCPTFCPLPTNQPGLAREPDCVLRSYREEDDLGTRVDPHFILYYLSVAHLLHF